jgi:hypothetical protein
VESHTSDPQPTPVVPDELVQFNFKLPRSWRDELTGIARERAISVSDLLRQMVRDFMRHRRLDQ